MTIDALIFGPFLSLSQGAKADLELRIIFLGIPPSLSTEKETQITSVVSAEITSPGVIDAGAAYLEPHKRDRRLRANTVLPNPAMMCALHNLVLNDLKGQ